MSTHPLQTSVFNTVRLLIRYTCTYTVKLKLTKIKRTTLRLLVSWMY